MIDVLNIAKYGAVPGEDCTKVFQAVLDVARTNFETKRGSVTVYIPAGRYIISGPLGIKSSAVSVIGDGWEQSIITQREEGVNTFEFQSNSPCWYNQFEGFRVEKAVGMTESAAFFLGRNDGSYVGGRTLFRNVSVSGFQFGIKVRHLTGLLCERVEVVNMRHGFYGEKLDAATFLNCHGGDAPGFSGRSAMYTLMDNPGPQNAKWPGFVTTVIGGETRGVDTVFDIGSGTFNVNGHHMEQIRETSVELKGTCRGGSLFGLSWMNMPATNQRPYITTVNYIGRNTLIGPCYMPDMRKDGNVVASPDGVIQAIGNVATMVAGPSPK